MNQSYLRMMMKVRHLDHPYSTIGDLTLWATSQNIIKSNALLHKLQLFIGSLERSRRAESELT